MKKLMFVILVAVLSFTACTENQRTKIFGSTMEVEVPKGYKVTMATWKKDNLFYMYEEMDSTYVPKTKYFVEKSTFGVIESTVVFKESR